MKDIVVNTALAIVMVAVFYLIVLAYACYYNWVSKKGSYRKWQGEWFGRWSKEKEEILKELDELKIPKRTSAKPKGKPSPDELRSQRQRKAEPLEEAILGGLSKDSMFHPRLEDE